MSPVGEVEFREVVQSLLKSAGIVGDFTLQPLQGGGNNRAYVVQAGRPYFLKHYFHDERDVRDRLGAEFAFAAFGWKHHIHQMPQPLAADYTNKVGLFEFIKGRPLGLADINSKRVQEALNFFRTLNNYRDDPDAQKLPMASDACLSMEDYFQLNRSRLGKLRDVAEVEKIDKEAMDFIRRELIPAWEDLSLKLEERILGQGYSLVEKFNPADLSLSPSDFGFHNALIAGNGEVKFIDFEYAGWDDPVKMVCDFFSQHKVPVPMNFYAAFLSDVVSSAGNPLEQKARAPITFILTRFKWCCLFLNVFLPVNYERRKFAENNSHEIIDKSRQLEQARESLAAIQQLRSDWGY